MRDELQELVDRVAGLLGAPATLEDADLTLLAFCAHPVDGAETPEGRQAAFGALQSATERGPSWRWVRCGWPGHSLRI